MLLVEGICLLLGEGDLAGIGGRIDDEIADAHLLRGPELFLMTLKVCLEVLVGQLDLFLQVGRGKGDKGEINLVVVLFELLEEFLVADLDLALDLVLGLLDEEVFFLGLLEGGGGHPLRLEELLVLCRS